MAGKLAFVFSLFLAISRINAFGQSTVTTFSATPNTVPLFADYATVTNSNITQSGGNIGIGTVNPVANLHVIGSVYAENGESHFWYGTYVDPTPLIAKAIKIGAGGIGVTGTSVFSGLSSTSTAPSSIALQANNGFSKFQYNTSSLPSVDFGGGMVIGWNRSAGLGETNLYNVYPNAVTAFQFTQLSLSGIGTNLMTLLGSGNVGIGTATPSSSLEVNGSVKLTSGSGASITFPDSTIQSTAWNGTTFGGDYAESVDVSGTRASYEPGDVIVIDQDISGKFVKSQESYSTMVAGVFSTKPGLLGRRVGIDRSDREAEVPMAMMGIVPTKVTTENGAIKRGDLLVTSSTPGYAMKGTDRDRMMGAVIGKALAPLGSGSGTIEVLISLQ